MRDNGVLDLVIVLWRQLQRRQWVLVAVVRDEVAEVGVDLGHEHFVHTVEVSDDPVGGQPFVLQGVDVFDDVLHEGLGVRGFWQGFNILRDRSNPVQGLNVLRHSVGVKLADLVFKCVKPPQDPLQGPLFALGLIDLCAQLVLQLGLVRHSLRRSRTINLVKLLGQVDGGSLDRSLFALADRLVEGLHGVGQVTLERHAVDHDIGLDSLPGLLVGLVEQIKPAVGLDVVLPRISQHPQHLTDVG